MRTRVFPVCTLAFLILCPTFALAQPGSSVVFHGTEVFPLGNATLTVPPGTSGARAAPMFSNRLFVGNLSFSGSDGFSAHIGGGTGGLVGFLDEAASFPVGGELDFRALDPAGLDPCIRVARVVGGVAVDPDFSAMGASSYRVEVWNDGAPVAEFDGMSGDLMATGFPSRFLVDLKDVTAPLPASPAFPATAPFPLSNSFQLRWSSDVTFLSGSTPLATGDELHLFPEGGNALAAVMSIDVLVTMPAGLPAYTMSVDDLAQQQFGRMHRGTGAATIAASFGGGATTSTHRTPFSNHSDMTLMLGPGELGGIQFDMHPSQSGDDLIWDLKDGFVTGDIDEFSVTGELPTGGAGEVGKVTSLYTGSGWSVTPDFSGSGSPDTRVEVYDASGNLMGIDPCVVGPFTVATLYRPIHTGVDNNEKFAIEFRYDSPVVVDLPGAGSFSGSSIRMLSNASIRPQLMYTIGHGFVVATAADFHITDEASAFGIEPEPFRVEIKPTGTPYVKAIHGGLLIDEIDTSGNDGVEIEPCIVPGNIPPDQFGVEWMPLGPPSANMGESDWAFLSKLATDSAPVKRMGISMSSDGAAVSLFAQPGPIQIPDVRVVLRNGGQVVAEFVHSGSGTPFAQLPDWPIAVGYQELAYPDQPWSMQIGLGYEMDVITPGGPMTTRAAGATPLTKADLIEVIALNTPNPGHSERRVLAGKFAWLGHIIFRSGQPVFTGVGDTPRTARSVLHPAYPNPFNPHTTVAFDMARGGRISLRIFAVDGRYVATVYEGALAAGPHSFEWNGTNHRGERVASGTYLVELRAPDGTLATKVNLLK